MRRFRGNDRGVPLPHPRHGYPRASHGSPHGRRRSKLNVDDNPSTTARFGVQSIPTLLVLKDGQEVDRLVGVQPRAEIIGRFETVMN